MGDACDLVIPPDAPRRPLRDLLASIERHPDGVGRVVVATRGAGESDGVALDRALRETTAPFVAVLSPRALLPKGALPRLLDVFADPAVGAVSALHDAVGAGPDQGPLAVRVPPGLDVFTFAARVQRCGPARGPDAPPAPGSLLALRRASVDRWLDPGLPLEDALYVDLPLRLRRAGHRHVVADDVYVPGPGAAARPADPDLAAVAEADTSAFVRRNELGARRDPTTLEWVAPDPKPDGPLDVLFVLPMMGVFGGVADVLELANALILQGRRAGVVLLSEIGHELSLDLLFRPLRLAPGRFLEDLPGTRVLVATSYPTAIPVALAATQRPGMRTAYFTQDYEGWFGDHDADYVARTYALVPRLTAISSWLAEQLRSRHGIEAAVIPMSADPEQFHPRGTRPERPVRVVAMLRPEERRGARYLLPALVSVSREPDVEIVLFGSHSPPRDTEPFPHRHLGLLTREQVAELLSSAHVVVDPSLYQGFGLVGLEGMASGAACVLTASGGIAEYAVDGVNALVVPTRDAAALAAAIRRLVRDEPLRDRLATEGRRTAERFTWARAATLYAAFLDSLPEPTGAARPEERAALELLWEEARRDPVPGPMTRTSETPGPSLYRAALWRSFQLYWRLTGRVRPGADPPRARSPLAY